MTSLNIMSFGGGVQSTAMMILAAKGEIPHRTAVFANVGEDSENPHTFAYIEEHTKPYCKAHGIDFVEVRLVMRDGVKDTIWMRQHRQQRSVIIPAYMANGAPGRRQCTYKFKILQISKWLKKQGATPENPANVALGISMDEFSRMRTSTVPNQNSVYPLIDLRMTRDDCAELIASEGLPVPPKSSCFFCPFKRRAEWIDMKNNDPDLFARAVELERVVNEVRDRIGKDHVYLSATGKPLEEAFGPTGQLDMFEDQEDGTCDIAGYCMV